MPLSTSYENTNSQMESALVFVEEISHRVINDYSRAISALSLAARTIDHVPARLAILGAVRSLHSQADAHRALQAPFDRGNIDIGDYLQTACAAVSNASLARAEIRLTLSRCTVQLPADLCWRIGLVVTELVNNAARHGLGWAAGDIRVDLETTKTELRCSVSDSGRAPAAPKRGRGSKIVSALVADLGGRIDWSFDMPGVSVVVRVPLPAGHESPST